MAKKASRARESRVNIQISDALKGNAEPDLPFRILVMGDYTLKEDAKPIEDRKPVDVNSSNFGAVMQNYNLALDLTVPDRISGEGEMSANLRFNSLKDFRPEAIARQVPQLNDLLDTRNALKALRPHMNKSRAHEILGMVKDAALREKIMAAVSSPGEPEATPVAETPPPDDAPGSVDDS